MLSPLSPLRVSNLTNLSLKRPVFATGFQTKQKLVHIKAVLAQNGITDLASLGKLKFERESSITPTPGILVPPVNSSNIMTRYAIAHRSIEDR
jgi:hypothetical protein